MAKEKLPMRTEKYLIKRGHPKYKLIDEMCFNSKQLYNKILHIIKEEIKTTGTYTQYKQMNFNMKSHELYKACMSQPANSCLRRLYKNIKSYEEGIVEYNKRPYKFLGKPHPPKYLKYNGRYVWEIPNNSCYINPNDEHELCFRIRKLQDFKWRINNPYNGRLVCVRFTPKGTCYVMEVVYEMGKPREPTKVPCNIASIDLGVNNFVTLVDNIGNKPIIINGKYIKSINQFYNKRRAKLFSLAMKRNDQYWSKQLEYITQHRFRQIEDFLHKSSRYIVNYCLKNDIDTLIVGHNKKWKQKKRKKQNFVYIPYNVFINQLKYKCEDVGINFIISNESYTSGTSFLDGELPIKENYNKCRRIKRGLFQSDNGRLINSDVNGALQIMRKVSSDACSNTSYDVGVYLMPSILNIM